MSKTGSSLSISSLRNLYGIKNPFGGGLSASPSSPVYSISSSAASSFNYTDEEMRRFASFALDKFNQSLGSHSAAAVAVSQSFLSISSSSSSYSILLFICIVLTLSIVVLFGFRVFTNVSNKRRQRSALNSLLSRLSQASAAKLESTTNMSTSTTTTPSSHVPETTSTTTTKKTSRSTVTSSRQVTSDRRLSFKLLIKDFNSFRNKHFTIRLPKWRSIRDVGVRRKQEEKQKEKKFSESSSSSSSSSTSSSSCDSNQFKEIINQNKYMNVRNFSLTY